MRTCKTSKFSIFKACITAVLLYFLFIKLIYNISSNIHREYEEAGGEIVVLFDNAVSDEYLSGLVRTYDTKIDIIRHIDDYALLYVEDSAKYQPIINNLKSNPEIAVVQENSSISSLGFSNDTFADTQWALFNPGQYEYVSEAGRETRKSTVDIDMDVPEAWEILHKEYEDTREVVVAVIDTGVDYMHPDLADHIWVNENEVPDDGIDNDKNGYVDDYHGWDFYNNDSTVCHYQYDETFDTNFALPGDNDDHGTHVAGIIGAVAGNNMGIAGIASNINIKLMVLKINGGPKGTGNISSAIEAVKYATMMGADIGNMSWGTSQYSEALRQVLEESDILFVAAAGNTGTNNNSSPVYPASLDIDNMISVTFVNSTGKLTSLANYGATSVDIAAPGEDIYSTIVGDYAAMSGSSMAAPQVTAIAAMLYSKSDNLYPGNIKEIILNSVKTLESLNGNIIIPGIPSAYLALMASDSLITDSDLPELSFKTVYNKDKMQIPVLVDDKGGSGVRVLKWIFGEKTLQDFKRGIAGTKLSNQQAEVLKAGIYTFYASDFAGNETVQFYDVKEDKTAPKISAYYTVAGSYKSRTIHARINDLQSGIQKVKYMYGNKNEAAFLEAGKNTEVKPKDGKVSFTVKKDGTYTIFAVDYRGNTTLKKIQVKSVKATDIKFARNKITLYVGDEYILRAYIKPVDTTDAITYTSSDAKIATISKTGIIKALKAGKVSISAKASSGIDTVCEITIKMK
ncbi:MAG: hypothetical protein K0S76_141 [Herbinix sp.]|jgi:subtilisin family serine protease|nr:hypothetical protein [Herbinix sp.]